MPQPAAHRSSINNNESIGGSSYSLTLLNLKVDQAVRYSELCERRILDYQPDHPLPIREEHLGLVFAQVDAHGTISDRKQMRFTQRSNQSPTTIQTTMRHGHGTANFVNRFDPNNETSSLASQGFALADGSPRALKQHVD